MQQLVNAPSDVHLPAPREPLAGDALVDRLEQGSRAPDSGDLVVILDDAQLLDDAAQGHELHRARRLGELAERGHGQVCSLEADP